MNFSFSGKEDEYFDVLRKFTLDELLKRINRESAELLKNVLFADVSGTKLASFPLIKSATKTLSEQDVYITGWNLIDLAYNAAICSNDYRGKVITDDKELYLLVSLTESIHAKRELERMDEENLGSNPNIFLYLWGFFGEQKKIQQPGKTFGNLARELYILFDLAPQIDGISNIQAIVKEEVGVCPRKLLTALFLAWFASTQSPTLKTWEQNLIWNEDLSLEEFQMVISQYTATYYDIRLSNIGRQILYAKPYICTQRKEVISVNCYLNFFLIEHCVLWCVRNHYIKNDDRRFTSEFGLLFETYFKELLEATLQKDEYDRIPEECAMRADWRIVLGKYRILVEQKSPLVGLLAKQQDSSIKAMETYCTRNIIKGINQLGETERHYGDGPYIKIILLYDDFLYTGILDHVFVLPDCKEENDNLYWLATIDEMETLLFIYSTNKVLFDKIMAEKIRREVEHSNEGKSFAQLFEENEISDNPYIAQDKFQKHVDQLKKDSLQHVITHGTN